MSTPHNKLIEELSEKIHHLYCEQFLKDNGVPYWTNGDYSKLDESTKEYDRNIARYIFDLLATREAQMIEAVEKAYYDSGLRISALFERDEKLCIEVGDATPEVVSIIDNRKFLDALAALRPQHLSN